jgi:predicted XRE-type DNA-binding protein
MSARSKGKEIVKEAGSNLFADFGIPDATEKNAKVQLAVAINQIIGDRGLNQTQAAELMNCSQPAVSDLLHYKLKIFSIERLIDFLLALDNDVEITIRPKQDHKESPKTTVKLEHTAA